MALLSLFICTVLCAGVLCKHDLFATIEHGLGSVKIRHFNEQSGNPLFLYQNARQISAKRYRRSSKETAVVSGRMDLESYVLTISDFILRMLTRDMFTLCPIASMCGHEVVFQDGREDTCCFTCSCDPHCIHTDSCCPHYREQALKITTNGQRNPFPHTECEQALYLTRTNVSRSDIIGLPKYKFVKSCSDLSTQSEKDLCRSEPTNGFRLEEVTPLFDTSTLTNYVNIHCAHCNAVNMKNVLPWKPIVRCTLSPLEATELSQLEEEIWDREDCMIEFLTPDSRANATACFSEPIVSTCNVTGLWRVHDESLIYSCSVYPLLFNIASDTTTRRYRNIYCALCNGEIVNQSVCGFENTGRFFSLLMSVKLKGPDDNVKKDLCQADSVFDPLTEQCQTVYCTPPNILSIQDKACVEMVTHGFVGDVIIPVRVTFSHKVPANVAVDSTRNYLQYGVISDIRLCNVTMYLKTKETINTLVRFREYTLIQEVMLIINIKTDRHGDATEMHKNILERLQMPYSFKTGSPLKQVSMDITLYGLDPLQQFPSDDSRYLSVGRLMEDFFYLDRNSRMTLLRFYEDPYDHNIVADSVKNAMNVCEGKNILYGLDFLPCMTFTYNINSSSLKRVPTGLMFNDRILFQFGEFISLNDSYVIICVDAVQQKFSRSTTHSYTCSLLILLLISIRGMTTM